MKSSKEFCFVCNEPVFFSNRQHLQNHMQKKHQDIYEIILKSDLLKSDDIVSFPGIPCGLVKVCFSFPLEIDGRQATLVLGHRICQKMDCATKWIDNEGNLLLYGHCCLITIARKTCQFYKLGQMTRRIDRYLQMISPQ